MTFPSCMFSRKREENRWGEKHELLNAHQLSRFTPTSFPLLQACLFISLWSVILIAKAEAYRGRSFVVGKSLATCGESFKMLSHFKLLIICSKGRPHTPISGLLYGLKERRRRNWKVRPRFWQDRRFGDPLSLVFNSQVAIFFSSTNIFIPQSLLNVLSAPAAKTS